MWRDHAGETFRSSCGFFSCERLWDASQCTSETPCIRRYITINPEKWGLWRVPGGTKTLMRPLPYNLAIAATVQSVAAAKWLLFWFLFTLHMTSAAKQAALAAAMRPLGEVYSGRYSIIADTVDAERLFVTWLKWSTSGFAAALPSRVHSSIGENRRRSSSSWVVGRFLSSEGKKHKTTPACIPALYFPLFISHVVSQFLVIAQHIWSGGGLVRAPCAVIVMWVSSFYFSPPLFGCN